MTTSGYHLVDDIPYYIAIVAAVWRLLTQVIDIAVVAIVAIEQQFLWITVMLLQIE